MNDLEAFLVPDNNDAVANLVKLHAQRESIEDAMSAIPRSSSQQRVSIRKPHMHPLRNVHSMSFDELLQRPPRKRAPTVNMVQTGELGSA